MFAGRFESLGYQQFTCDIAQSLTMPVNKTPFQAMIVVEGQAIRYRDDGTDPSVSTGMPLAVGATLVYDASNANKLRFISQVAGGIINCTFYGRNP